MLSTRNERKIHKFANNESNFLMQATTTVCACARILTSFPCNCKTNYYCRMHVDVAIEFLMQMFQQILCGNNGKWRLQC